MYRSLKKSTRVAHVLKKAFFMSIPKASNITAIYSIWSLVAAGGWLSLVLPWVGGKAFGAR